MFIPKNHPIDNRSITLNFIRHYLPPRTAISMGKLRGKNLKYNKTNPISFDFDSILRVEWSSHPEPVEG
jgi:hypothetical protein